VTEDTPLEIRSATVADTEALVALLAGGALTVPETAPGPGVDLGLYRAAVAEITSSPAGDILVAVGRGRVVGMCQLIMFRHLQAHGGLCAEIESMHVSVEHRSRGIGSLLVEAAVQRAAAAGCYRVQLTSNTQRTEAQRFYQRHGFVPSHVGYKRLL
jgi:GNAT superfamily N-acetyltransferase